MAKPEWGIKRICQSCSARFYDFDKTPIVCPKCGATFDAEAVLKSRRTRSTSDADTKAKAAAAAKAAPVADVEEEVEEDEMSEEDDLLEDASDLEDEDDVGVVIEAPQDNSET